MFASIRKKINRTQIKSGWNYFYKENYLIARKKIIRLTSSKDSEICKEANRIAGLAFYHQKRYQDAIPHLSITSSLSNQQHDWYNLAMTFVKANRVNEAEGAFKKIYRAKSKHDYQFAISLPMMIFQYMRALKQKRAYETAYYRVIELRSMYEALRKHDESFLLANGLPSIHNYLKEITPILNNLLSEQKVTDWINNFLKQANQKA